MTYRMFPTRVVRTARVTPLMIRVTLAGDLTEFVTVGPDQRVKLFFPLPGVDAVPELTGPPGTWYQAWRELPADRQPVMRTYTVRAHRPEQHEIDIDFAVHGDAGPASRWALRAAPGDPVTVLGPVSVDALGADHRPVPGTDWQLIAGDETALPAIARILEALAPGTNARVVVEVAAVEEIQPLPTAAAAEITWLCRGAAAPGTALVDAVRGIRPPAGLPYAWIAAEATAVREIRRYLLGEAGLDRASAYFCGYWRRGKTEDARRDEPAEEYAGG